MNGYQHWHYEQDTQHIVWLSIDRADASANVLTETVLKEFVALLDEIQALQPRALVIRSAKASGFIAGADIRDFTPMPSRAVAHSLIKRGQAAFDKLDGLACTTVCLIRGFCLGGGLELALACDVRIACEDDSTRLGLPEIKLGIHPGFGGTARLVPLIGDLAALDLMLTGRTVRPRVARRLRLVDYVVPERQLVAAARRVALDPPRRNPLPLWKRLTNQAWLRPALAWWLKRRVAVKANPAHYPAPGALIELWRRHGDNQHAMLEAEAESVADLLVGDTAQNLVRVFLLQERLKSLGKGAEFRARHVHVIGAGVMGGDIAAWCASRGLRVSLQDQSPERIAPAVGRAYRLFCKRLKDKRKVTAAMDRLIPDVDGQLVARADVVIEAIFEDREAKRELFRFLEPRLKPGALLATNTSSIPLEELAECLQEPQRLVGLHFFNPVVRMQLIEVVQGKQTDTAVARAAMAFARQLDRLPLPVISSPGFLVNRVLMPYLLEAVQLVEEGVPAILIDRAATDFGMPMGPVELADTVGLDICLHVAGILGEELGLPVPERLKTLVAAGRLGRKSGAGFYQYRQGKPVPERGSSVQTAPADLCDRLILRYLNEAMACRREGVVAEADLLDAGMIFGTGFAPFRGGPLHYVAAAGKDAMIGRLHEMQSRYGSRFAPDPGWQTAQTSKDNNDAA